MASPTLELTLISAEDLKDVNLISKMEVYALVSIAGDHRSQQRTPTDRHNAKNPAWNTTLRFSLPPTGDLSRHVLHILLRSERALGDRDIGEVRIPLSELLDDPAAGKGLSTFFSYQVRKPSGKPMGVLNFSYKFMDSSPTKTTLHPPPAAKYEEPAKASSAYQQASKPEPVASYPAAPSTGTAHLYLPQAYPTASAGYGYWYPLQHQAADGNAPAQAGYAAAPQQPKKNEFGGMGMGMGLGAGLLGGASVGCCWVRWCLILGMIITMVAMMMGLMMGEDLIFGIGF